MLMIMLMMMMMMMVMMMMSVMLLQARKMVLTRHPVFEVAAHHCRQTVQSNIYASSSCASLSFLFSILIKILKF